MEPDDSVSDHDKSDTFDSIFLSSSKEGNKNPSGTDWTEGTKLEGTREHNHDNISVVDNEFIAMSDDRFGKMMHVQNDRIVTSDISTTNACSPASSQSILSSQTKIDSQQAVNTENHSLAETKDSQNQAVARVSRKSIHRTYPGSDILRCDYCRVKDDKWGMRKHVCEGILKLARSAESILSSSRHESGELNYFGGS